MDAETRDQLQADAAPSTIPPEAELRQLRTDAGRYLLALCKLNTRRLELEDEAEAAPPEQRVALLDEARSLAELQRQWAAALNRLELCTLALIRDMRARARADAVAALEQAQVVTPRGGAAR